VDTNPTVDEFLAHWGQANSVLPPAKPFVVRLPDTDVGVTRADLTSHRVTLVAREAAVQAARADHLLARASINTKKTDLLEQFTDFIKLFDGYYRQTDLYDLRPYAPSLAAGKEAFCDPMGEAMNLWTKVNASPAPAGVTLPLVLADGTNQAAFASALSALAFAYPEEKTKAQDLKWARAKRNRTQEQIYAVLLNYREAAPGVLTEFSDLLDTLPRLTPLPGHTPEPVNASAVFEAPDTSKVVYDASPDPKLAAYQLRGNVGDEYSDEDAVVIATNAPDAPREFVTPFGLNQPGAKVALKVFVQLDTGNEAGSAAMFVQRPLSLAA
jgi:hypothetical protein